MTKKCPVCENTIDENSASCSACGFKLLGATQQFKPVAVDDEAVSSQPGKKAADTVSLRVIRGPQIHTVFPLAERSFIIGRNPQCDIFLNDMTVSREHARLEYLQNEYIVSDMDSFNGVWVNNRNVETAVLKPGDVIQLGAFSLVFESE